MLKSSSQIDRISLQRSWVGLHDLTNPKKEEWHEIGHYYKGVEFKLVQVREHNGLKQKIGGALGMMIEGSAEPAQNIITTVIDNFVDYTLLLNGVRNFAGLVSNRLWLFRLKSLGGAKYQDNRIALSCDLGYANQRDKAYLEFSGWIASYERYLVTPESVNIQGGKLVWSAPGGPITHIQDGK